MTPAAYVKHSEPFDLSEWELPFGELNDQITKTISEWIVGSLKDHPFEASFAYTSPHCDGIGGQPSGDPGSIYFHMPLFSKHGCVGPTCKFSLSELVDYTITSESEADGGYDKDMEPRIKDMAKHLRDLADKLEESI